MQKLLIPVRSVLALSKDRLPLAAAVDVSCSALLAAAGAIHGSAAAARNLCSSGEFGASTCVLSHVLGAWMEVNECAAPASQSELPRSLFVAFDDDCFLQFLDQRR